MVASRLVAWLLLGVFVAPGLIPRPAMPCCRADSHESAVLKRACDCCAGDDDRGQTPQNNDSEHTPRGCPECPAPCCAKLPALIELSGAERIAVLVIAADPCDERSPDLPSREAIFHPPRA